MAIEVIGSGESRQLIVTGHLMDACVATREDAQNSVILYCMISQSQVKNLWSGPVLAWQSFGVGTQAEVDAKSVLGQLVHGARVVCAAKNWRPNDLSGIQYLELENCETIRPERIN